MEYIYLRGTCIIKPYNYKVIIDEGEWYNYEARYRYFNYKLPWPNDCNKGNTGIVKNKGINSGAFRNISKKGQEILKTAYSIQSITEGYYKSITS